MAWYRCGGTPSNVLALPTPSEASGAIAQFNTDLTENLLHAVADFSATQDLHGQAFPYPAGGGKNKANFVNGYGISISGEVEANLSRFATVEAIPIKSGETYYVKKMQSGACSFIVAVYNGTTLVSRVSGLNSGDTIDTTGGDNFRVAGYSSSGSVTFEAVEAMVVIDNTVSAYSPYANICPIVSVSEVNITRTGANLWDEEWELGLINDSDGQNSPNSTLIRSKNYIPVNPNATYYFNLATKNAHVFCYDQNKTYLGYINLVGNNTFTPLANTAFIRFRMNTAYGTTYNNDLSINYPSTDTEYHAHTGNTTVIIYLGGNYYGGYVDAVTGEIVIDKKIVVIDGSQTITVATTSYIKSDACDSFITDNDIYPRSNPSQQPDKFALCDTLNPVKAFIWNTSGNVNCMTINTNQIHLNISNDLLGITDYTQETTATAKAKIQSFLQNNPITVVFGISPIKIYASNTAQIPTLNGLNLVYADTGDVEAEYLETVGHKIS